MKGAPIKPGTLCVIVGLEGPAARNNGIVVTAVKIVTELPHDHGARWHVEESSRPVWFASEHGIMTCAARHLLPISAPDADIATEEAKELVK